MAARSAPAASRTASEHQLPSRAWPERPGSQTPDLQWTPRYFTWHTWINEWKCEDFKCVWKPTESRLCLTHYVNKSSRWAKNSRYVVILPTPQQVPCHFVWSTEGTWSFYLSYIRRLVILRDLQQVRRHFTSPTQAPCHITWPTAGTSSFYLFYNMCLVTLPDIQNAPCHFTYLNLYTTVSNKTRKCRENSYIQKMKNSCVWKTAIMLEI